jgi:hypothetical protein
MTGRRLSLPLAVLLCAALPCDVGAAPPVFGGTRALNLTAPVDGGIDLYNSHATDGAGNWVAMWTKTTPDPVHPHGNDVDLMVTRSSDDGCTWSAPELFPAWATTDIDHDYFPDLAAGGGVWIVVWASTAFGPSAYGVAVSRSTDNGVTWSAPMPIESNSGSTIPRVAFGQGAFIASWLTSAGTRVSRSTNGGVTWSTPTIIVGSPQFGCCGEPVLATDGGGGWVVVWHQTPTFAADPDIMFSRSTDNGVTWSAAAPLHPDAATDNRSDGEPQVAADAGGKWVVISQANTGPPFGESDIWVSRGQGSVGNPPLAWSLPVVLHPSMATDGTFETDLEPDLTTNGLGDWAAVWNHTFQLPGPNVGDVDILLSTSTNNGLTWSTPVPVKSTWSSDGFVPDDSPRIATGATGVWVATWAAQDPLYGNQPPLSDANEILVANTFCAGLDHFLSYAVNKPQTISVTLDDVLNTATYTATKVKRFYTPADKNGEGLSDPLTHLSGYRLSGPITQRTGIAAVNQFGSFSLDTRRRGLLLVPTAKTLPPAAPPSTPPATAVDHYHCEVVRLTPGSPDPPPRDITVVDQFGTRHLAIKRPKLLCVATDKNGEGINRPDAHLLCHPARPTPPHTIAAAQTIDQFGSRVVAPNKEREFCVPTSIVMP